jgi:sarcosine oxidase
LTTSAAADVVVIGLGAHGSAAARAAVERGVRVIGLERFGRGHELGSSGGRTRIIRVAYFEHPSYVPLVLQAWQAWVDLETATGARILEPTGGLYAGPPTSDVFQGSLRSSREHGLPHEVLPATEMRLRFPQFRIGDETSGIYEERAGLLRTAAAIEAQLSLAERAGADLRFGAQVLGWEATPTGITVRTDEGTIACGSLVLAAGAWTDTLLHGLDLGLWVERVPVFWFEPLGGPEPVSAGHLPVWIFETATDGAFYGFQYEPDAGLKVARHHSGVRVDPDTVDRTATPADEARVRRFMRSHLPIADGPVRGSSVCLYTNTPDEHFVIDRHPESPNVVFASACSGHGFKFSPVIGAALADLALDGRTDRPVDFLRMDPAVRPSAAARTLF